MTEKETDDYAEWLKDRRAAAADERLTAQIMTAVEQSVPRPMEASSHRSSSFIVNRLGPILLWTAASLVFVARIASLVGNLAFPTQSYPEIAVDHRIEEPSDEHRNVSRS